MIRSMTGYARVEASFVWGRLSWELRSVNHRYFDVSFKVPEEFRCLEAELRQIASGRIARGKVECGLRYAQETAIGETITVDRARLAQIKVVNGAPMVTCPYCHTVYQITEEPKW